MNKQVQLETFLINNDIDIIIGTDSEIFPNNFHTYRKDRNNYGGGVFVSVKNTIHPSQMDTNSPIETVWTYVRVGKNNDVIVGSFYCPPHSTDTVLEDF